MPETPSPEVPNVNRPPESPVKESNREKWTRRAKSLMLDLVIAGTVFWVVASWREADLLQKGEMVPSFVLPTLAHGETSMVNANGKPTLLYFFAPWCGVCAAVSPTVRSLGADDELQANVIAVALEYDSVEAVQAFVADHELNVVPILLGDKSVTQTYNIRAFPTFYVLDPQGRVTGSTVGLSTEAGLRVRLWNAARGIEDTPVD